MHEATATPVSLLYIDAMRWWRKESSYGDRVREVELASFTPFVFLTTGGMGREGTVFYRWLANLYCQKAGLGMWFHHFLFSYLSLLRSTIMCIQGNRSISFMSSFASAEMGLAMSRSFWCLKSSDFTIVNHFIYCSYLICWIIGDDFYLVMHDHIDD